MTAPQINDDRLPTTADLDKFKSCSLQDSTGKSHRISDLFEQASSNKTKLIVCFVRHFHCGFCLQYCSKICEHPAAKDPPLKIIVIGHGQSSTIQRYADLTGCEKAGIPVYTDPSKESFKALGVTKKTLAGPEGGKLPAYASGKSQLAMVWESLKETLGSGTQALKGGEYSQLGGEFVFDASGQPIFAHRMQNTLDHTEVDNLFKAAGAGSTADQQSTTTTSADKPISST